MTSATFNLLLVYQNGVLKDALYSELVRDLELGLINKHNRPRGSTKRGLRAFICLSLANNTHWEVGEISRMFNNHLFFKKITKILYLFGVISGLCAHPIPQSCSEMSPEVFCGVKNRFQWFYIYIK